MKEFGVGPDAPDHWTLSRRALFGLAGQGVVLGASTACPSWAWAAVTEKYPTVRKRIDAYIASKKAAGIVAAIGRGTPLPDIVASGKLALDSKVAVNIDSLFRIYSMTKPITGMAAMMLVEEGKITLDQPIADFLPAFANMKVLTKPDSSMESVAAKTKITLRHLLTHTAGLGYAFIGKGPIRQAYIDNGVSPERITRIPVTGFISGKPAPSLKAFADNLARLPLVYEPGTRWSYSVALDLTGRLIEVVSGQAFDVFLQQRIFDPLKMTSTYFQVPRSEAARMTTNYFVLAGRLIPVDSGSNSIFFDKPPFPFGGSGLVSSARDYDRFLSMLLGKGALDGVRVMKPETVDLATSNLLPKAVNTKGTVLGGDYFGAGGRVGTGTRDGVFGWSGAAGTIGVIHKKLGVRAIGMTQYMPYDAWDFVDDFPQWVLADIGNAAR